MPADESERLVVINPCSASGRTARRWPQLVAELNRLGVATNVQLTKAPGHATQLVQEYIDAGGREIVVLGGDGTVTEVTDGCLNDARTAPRCAGTSIAIVHQGTGGDIGHGLGVPRDAPESLVTAATGALRTVDLGVAEYRTADGATARRGWIGCCNVGLGAEVVAKVVGKLKRFGDTASFGIATVGSLARNKPRSVSIQFDDQTAEAAEIVDVMVANNRFVGGGMHVAPGARMDDGLLDAVVIGAAGRFKLIRTFPKIYKGTHVLDPLVRVERVRELRIDTAVGREQGVVIDGELVGSTPVTFSVIPGALQVRVP